MRSLPDHVRQAPAIRVTSIARAVSPYLGLSADGLGSRRVEDAALTVLAAVYAERGPVREMLVCERRQLRPARLRRQPLPGPPGRCLMFPILEAGSDLEAASLPAFVVARDGLYLRKRSLLGVSQTKVGRIAHLPAGSEFVDYALPKVPADLMARVVGFFRAVYRLHRTEAAVLLVWRDGVFDLVVPPQKVTSVSVAFDVRDGDVPPGWRVVGSMHSHGAFGAYASTIDEDDEAELDGLHVVVGDLDRRRIGYAAAIVVDGVRFALKAGSLFERPRRFVEPPDGLAGQGHGGAAAATSQGHAVDGRVRSAAGSDPRTRSHGRAGRSSTPPSPRRRGSPPRSGIASATGSCRR